ncbi:MAG: glycosyltransferase family 2 protein [Thermoplasmataceae archaeon]
MASMAVNAVLDLMAFLIILYFPIAAIQLGLILKGWEINSDKLFTRFRRRGKSSFPMPPPILKEREFKNGRRIIVIITTNGKNPGVVDKITSVLNSYGLPIDVFVTKEEYDNHLYIAKEIVVPASYKCPNGSRHKLRALHYESQWLKEHGFGRETYVIHLDDDAIVSQEYIEYVYHMREEGGQGHLRLREPGIHIMSTLADMTRVSDCAAFCTYFNTRGKPMAVHGEGLVIRADVEEEIGWDYGTYGADDIIMSQLIVKNGYKFGYIPHPIYIAPPTTTRDFYKQRRRWIMSMLWARKYIKKINPKMFYWLIYRYSIGWTGFFGVFLAIPAILLHIHFPLWLEAISIFNTICYFVFYQYGAIKTGAKWSPIMLVLQFPIAIYEGGTLFYSLIYPPDKNVFDVITKV